MSSSDSQGDHSVTLKCERLCLSRHTQPALALASRPPTAVPPAPGQSAARLQLGWAAPGRPVAFQLDIKAVSKNKQTTSGAEGREVVPAGCLGSTSAIQSEPLGCEGNSRESITGRVCLQKDVCGCDSSGSSRGGPPGTHVHHLDSWRDSNTDFQAPAHNPAAKRPELGPRRL